MARYAAQRVRDPLHDIVEFKAEQFENVMWDVVQTRPFQRLRRVKQLGFSELVFPGATHTRFAHSIGVFHIARRLMNIIEKHVGTQGFEQYRANVALAAALVHDVGHGPFSHSFEDAGKKLGIAFTKHEEISAELIAAGEIADAMRPLGGAGFASEVSQLIKIDGPTDIYSAVVSSQFDADRLDYIQRDPMMAGTKHSRIDFTWLISNIEVGEVSEGVDEEFASKKQTFVLNPKAFYAAEAYILGLFHLYPTVYFHKATRSAEKMFTHILLRLFQLLNDNNLSRTGLQASNPLIQFLISPNASTFLCLDDTVVWGSLHELAGAADEVLSDLSVRLRDRKLFKSIDIREDFLQEFGRPVDDTVLDKCCVLASDSIADWLSSRTDQLPRIIADEGTRPTYKPLSEGKGALNQIHIKSNGGLMDMSTKSKAVAASGTFKFLRAYTKDEDEEAKMFMHRTIKEIAKREVM
jgi:uncharacterized protein